MRDGLRTWRGLGSGFRLPSQFLPDFCAGLNVSADAGQSKFERLARVLNQVLAEASIKFASSAMASSTCLRSHDMRGCA